MTTIEDKLNEILHEIRLDHAVNVASHTRISDVDVRLRMCEHCFYKNIHKKEDVPQTVVGGSITIPDVPDAPDVKHSISGNAGNTCESPQNPKKVNKKRNKKKGKKEVSC